MSIEIMKSILLLSDDFGKVFTILLWNLVIYRHVYLKAGGLWSLIRKNWKNETSPVTGTQFDQTARESSRATKKACFQPNKFFLWYVSET